MRRLLHENEMALEMSALFSPGQIVFHRTLPGFKGEVVSCTAQAMEVKIIAVPENAKVLLGHQAVEGPETISNWKLAPLPTNLGTPGAINSRSPGEGFQNDHAPDCPGCYGDLINEDGLWVCNNKFCSEHGGGWPVFGGKQSHSERIEKNDQSEQ